MTYTATYSPEDNKLRLYSSTRLEREVYARVRGAGFIYAPKQELFVAPMWTPEREDLLIELCGEIDDEDTSLVERAEERADRFVDYKDKRISDAERAHEAVSRIADNIPLGQPILIGHHSERFTPFLVTLGLFILIANLFGVVPGLESPTGSPVVPLGCAICAFVYYQVQGFRTGGVGYLKHFLGPMWWLSPLMLPLEIISHLARLMSLTIRLYANMFAGDMVTLVFFSLIPIAVPVIFLGLHIGVALLQAYIFVLLTTVYLAGAVATEH